VHPIYETPSQVVVSPHVLPSLVFLLLDSVVRCLTLAISYYYAANPVKDSKSTSDSA